MCMKQITQAFRWSYICICMISIHAAESSSSVSSDHEVVDLNSLADLDFDAFEPHITHPRVERDSILFANVARSGFHEQCKAALHSVYVALFMMRQWLLRAMGSGSRKMRA